MSATAQSTFWFFDPSNAEMLIKVLNACVPVLGNKYWVYYAATTNVELTATGTVLGTPMYMSPEQGYGRGSDARSDIYALGVMLFELVTGHLPFEGDTPMSIVLKQINQPLPSARQLNPHVSKEIDLIIAKATAKAPQARFQTCAGFATALEATQPPATATPEPGAEQQQVAPTPTPVPLPPDVITLIVSPQDAVTLNYLMLAGANLNMVLRSAGDTDVQTTEAVTLQFILDQYQIPNPAKLPYGLEPRIDTFPDRAFAGRQRRGELLRAHVDHRDRLAVGVRDEDLAGAARGRDPGRRAADGDRRDDTLARQVDHRDVVAALVRDVGERRRLRLGSRRRRIGRDWGIERSRRGCRLGSESCGLGFLGLP